MSPLPVSARTLFCLLALLSSSSGGEVWAQDAPISPGKHVRVWTQTDAQGRPWGAPTEGRLTLWTPDSLVVDYGSPHGPWVVPLVSVSRLDVSHGREPRGQSALKGAGVGLLIGAGIGAALGLVSASETTAGCWVLCTPAELALFGGVLFGSAGTILGGILGALDPGEYWGRVPLPGRMSIAPTKEHGLKLSASHRF